MKHLLLTIGCALLFGGCGGSSGEGPAQDEAGVGFKPPMLLASALEVAHRHHVQPTELTMGFPLLGETISTHAVLEEDLSDAQIEAVSDYVASVAGKSSGGGGGAGGGP